MSMGGMTAFAEVSAIDIQKVVTTDGKTYAPNTSFSFEVLSAEAGSFGEGNQKVDYYGSVNGGLTISSDKTASYSPADGIIDGDDGLKKTVVGAIEVNDNVFADQPTGVYKYVVKEVIPEDKYEGIKYDETAYNVYLYVTEKEGGGKEVSSVVVTEGDNNDIINNGDEKTGEILFTNDYGKDSDNDKTHDLTITKEVTGALGEKNREFEISVKIDGVNGEKYNVVTVVKGGEGEEDETPTSPLTSGEVGTYYLKDGESIRIYGLSENDQYTVVENEKYAVEEGYTVTYSDEDGKGTVSADDTELTITNHKDAVTPTGIVMTFAPYVALIGLAGVFAATFLRKRREDF